MMTRIQQHKAFIGGIWLIGLGILFATRFWWPGIMFLIGITAIVEGWLRRQPGMDPGGFWSILIGVWALTGSTWPFSYRAGDQRDRREPWSGRTRSPSPSRTSKQLE